MSDHLEHVQMIALCLELLHNTYNLSAPSTVIKFHKIFIPVLGWKIFLKSYIYRLFYR